MESNSPQIIGVLDLMAGVAVRAVGGRREEYLPIESRLCDSSDPLRIAAAFRQRHGIENLYVADLDAIRGEGSNSDIVAGLIAEGFQLAVDAGLHTAADAELLRTIGVETIVAGLETLAGPGVLADLVAMAGAERVAFSIDLAGGIPLADPARWGETAWQTDSPLRLAQRAAEAGVSRLIALDLHAVGTARGPATADLCRRISETLPQMSLWTGGGVRTVSDVQTLAAAGAAGLLVASALHDGTLTG